MFDREERERPEMDRLDAGLRIEQRVEHEVAALVEHKAESAPGKELHSVGGDMLILLSSGAEGIRLSHRRSGGKYHRNDEHCDANRQLQRGTHVALWKGRAPRTNRRRCADGKTGGHAAEQEHGRHRMLETIAIILIVLWLLGIVSGYTMGNFIYVLLVIAIVLFLVRLISGRRVV